MRLSVLALAAVTQTALGCTFGIALTHSTVHGSNEVECFAQIWGSDDVDFWNDEPASYTNTECQAGCYDVEHKGNTYQFCFDSVANNRLHGEATVQLTSNGGGDLLYIQPDGEEYHKVANVFLGKTDYRAYYLAALDLGFEGLVRFLTCGEGPANLSLHFDFPVSICSLNLYSLDSPPGGYLNHTTDANSNQTSTGEGEITTAAPVPTNALDESNRNCGLWYTVVKGDTCAGVSLAQSISLDDFYFLNPEIDADCTNLQLDVAYCVQAVGWITTYANYTLTDILPITVTSATFPSVNTAIPTATKDPGYIYTPAPLMPTASGTIPDCYQYANADNYTTLCRDLLGSYEISFEQLLDWNPSLDTDKYNCTLSLSNSYCVLQYDNSTETSEWTTSNCRPINATESSTVSNCNCFGIVDGLGAPSDFACKDFMSNFNITKADLLNWNPWLATGDCDAALYSDLPETATRAVCIGTGTATTTLPADTASVTATRTTASIGPTQTDTVSGCKKYHTVEDGDDCPSIESEYGITLAELYQWNPSIGKTCTNLWLGYAYCVEGPTGTGSATAAATSTSSLNTAQTGIATDCNKYHNVGEGDSCAQVEEDFGLTFAQLYKWNSAIGSGCEALQIGTAVCVGVSS